MAVEVNNRTGRRVNGALIRRAVQAALDFAQSRGDVSVAVVGDRRMTALNRLYRGMARPTDVLSFVEAESDAPEPGLLGEVVIDYEQIKRQAAELGHGIRFELAFIVIHGVLHVLGYEDESEAGRLAMHKLGRKIIKRIIL